MLFGCIVYGVYGVFGIALGWQTGVIEKQIANRTRILVHGNERSNSIPCCLQQQKDRRAITLTRFSPLQSVRSFRSQSIKYV